MENKALNTLPDWYKLPTVEEGYRFLEVWEIPTKGCQQWIDGEWGGLIERYSYIWPDMERSICNREGRYLFRTKI